MLKALHYHHIHPAFDTDLDKYLSRHTERVLRDGEVGLVEVYSRPKGLHCVSQNSCVRQTIPVCDGFNEKLVLVLFGFVVTSFIELGIVSRQVVTKVFGISLQIIFVLLILCLETFN